MGATPLLLCAQHQEVWPRLGLADGCWPLPHKGSRALCGVGAGLPEAHLGGLWFFLGSLGPDQYPRRA